MRGPIHLFEVTICSRFPNCNKCVERFECLTTTRTFMTYEQWEENIRINYGYKLEPRS